LQGSKGRDGEEEDGIKMMRIQSKVTAKIRVAKPQQLDLTMNIHYTLKEHTQHNTHTT
jgi:hypothetical protein